MRLRSARSLLQQLCGCLCDRGRTTTLARVATGSMRRLPRMVSGRALRVLSIDSSHYAEAGADTVQLR